MSDMNSDLSFVLPYRTIPAEKWVAAIVSAHYGFPVESCRLLLAGVNDHFMVESETRRFAVRLYRSGCSKAQIEAELSFLAHLADEGVSVATAVSTESEETLVECKAPEGTRYLTVFTWAHGRVQKAEDASLYGKALARLHIAADKFDQRRLPQLDLRKAVRQGAAYLQSLAAYPESERMTTVLEAVQNALEVVLSSNFDVGAVHGDSHAGNANIDGDGIVTFYDFDFCCVGPRAFDLATFRWSNEICDTHSDAAWDQFISGYQSLRQLADSDVRNALLLRPVRHMWWLDFWQANENRFGVSTFVRNNQPVFQLQRLLDWTCSQA